MSPISRNDCVSLLGCGWLGLPVAEKLITAGLHVRGSTTHASKLSVLSSLGIESLLMRIDPGTEEGWTPSEATARFFDSATMILGLPPQAALGEEHFTSQVETILARRGRSSFEHLVFISSTSVFGAKQGSVDETTLPKPDSEAGIILAKVEQRLVAAAGEQGFRLTIVRPGGLIGPGRHPGLFLAGRKNAKDPESPINLIHQMDCAEAVATLVRDTDGLATGESRTFNLVSDRHPTRREFYTRASQAVGVEAPEFSPQTEDSADKVVQSARIRTLMQFEFDDLLASMGAKT
ncbi:MAG: NAD-dependent epimerase/dehydratase family protein [Bdellovibrionota bacterium]